MKAPSWLLGLGLLWLAMHLLLRAGRRTVFVAHRGAAGEAPENTLAAMETGASSGAPYVEIDVRSSRDGELVVIHDADLERTTDGSGKVAQTDRSQLRAIDAGGWYDPAFEGERIPTLAEGMARLRGWQGTLVIEAKDPDAQGEMATELAAVLKANPSPATMVVSFDHRWLRQLRRRIPEIPIGQLSIYPLGLPSPSEADRIGVFWLAPLLDPTLLPRAHRTGLEVWVWTVDAPPLQDLLAWIGVDAITTNLPTEAIQRRPGSALDSR